jgi:hypothetical protein
MYLLQVCNKTNPINQPLKPCNKFKNIAYCDRKCQQAHFKADDKPCQEQNLAQDPAARDEVRNERAAKDASAEQLAVDFLAKAPSETDEQSRVICSINEHGTTATRALDDGKKHVQTA